MVVRTSGRKGREQEQEKWCEGDSKISTCIYRVALRLLGQTHILEVNVRPCLYVNRDSSMITVFTLEGVFKTLLDTSMETIRRLNEK